MVCRVPETMLGNYKLGRNRVFLVSEGEETHLIYKTMTCIQTAGKLCALVIVGIATFILCLEEFFDGREFGHRSIT